jgi:hypothetical protein
MKIRTSLVLAYFALSVVPLPLNDDVTFVVVRAT